MEEAEIQKLISVGWIKFPTQKLVHANVVWMDQKKLTNKFKFTSEDAAKEMLLSEAAYVIKDTPCFETVKADRTNERSLVAERYGGVGTGGNGGGSRCGNSNLFQLKGIGANCMVGNHNNIEYNYGGLDARKAIVETIYTCVLGQILPRGTVNIYALILTGEDTGFNGLQACWGVIMVRDNCVRPAHLMRNHGFTPLIKYKSKTMSDPARLRILNKSLANYFKDHHTFIEWIGKTLQNAANQFSFALAARITHATISPSNICMDGRWLDLPVASFLSGGVNYNISSEFYAEHHQIIKYIKEIVHNYAKYNQVMFDSAPLVEYYYEQFDAYFEKHVGYVLGLNSTAVDQFEGESWGYITKIFRRVITSGTYIEMHRPVPKENDPVNALIVASYVSLSSPEHAQRYFNIAGLKPAETSEFVNHFHHIMVQHSCNISPSLTMSKLKFFSCALKALKRAYLSEAFYLPVVDDYVKELCNFGEPAGISILIDSYRNIANWVYDDACQKIVLYSANKICVSYLASSHEYSVNVDDKNYQTFKSFNLLYDALCLLNKDDFKINKFNFFKFFKKLNSILIFIEQPALDTFEVENV